MFEVIEVCAAGADAVAGVVAFKHPPAMQATTLSCAVIFSGIMAATRRGAGHRVFPPADQKSRPCRGRPALFCYRPL